MAGFLFRLATPDERQLNRQRSTQPVGSMIYVGARSLRVIANRDDDADQPPVLVVEDAVP